MDLITQEQLAACQIALEEQFVSYVKARSGNHPQFPLWKAAFRRHDKAESERLLAILHGPTMKP